METGYIEYTFIWDGALEETIEAETAEAVAEAVAQAEKFIAEAKADGVDAEVYVLEHNHSPEAEDCECMQFCTDMRPDFSTLALGRNI